MLSASIASRRFDFYLLPAFSLQAFSSALEVLRLANEVIGHSAYSWRIISNDGEPVASNSGLLIGADASLTSERGMTRGSSSTSIVVVGGSLSAPQANKQLDAWLRESRNRGFVAGIGDGVIVLARAGLAEARRCAVHWEQFPAFREHFPSVFAVQTTFEQDGDLYTCAGGDAPFDMFLSVVENDFGSLVVSRIRQRALAFRLRCAGDRQRPPGHSRVRFNHQAVLAAIDLMEATIGEPMHVDALATTAGKSRRQIERLFRRELGCTPSRYYLGLRLERAHLLLISSCLSIVEIAMACGFVSASHFSKTYRDSYGCAPRQSRLADASEARSMPSCAASCSPSPNSPNPTNIKSPTML